MKILIYGGTFDPVHIGHLKLFSSAIKEIKPDLCYVFVAYNSPYKEVSQTPYNLRKLMVQKVFMPLHKKIIFDDFEYKKHRKVYTFETLKYVKQKYPKAEICILVGTDCAATLSAWKNAKYNFKNATFVIGLRPGYKVVKPKFKAHILKGTFPKISSSALRLQIMLNGKTPKAVLPEVAQIINKNLLYALHIHKWLKANLKAPRFNHVLAVAKEATALAKIYRIDTEKAALAGLLHDAGKSLTKDQMVAYAKKHKLKIEDFSEISQYAPALLHAEISADIAKRQFFVKNKEILNSIAHHTLGTQNMSTFDKILMISDMCAKGRRPQDIKLIKNALKKSLDDGLLAAETVKLIYTVHTNKWLAPTGIKLWNETVSKKK
ncbi:MAG: nicotinate (nicotinamide) nucleotide adenylyltransferase [Elusimicrobiaceae bacterium]|nr:nicotinate (nicotinamide) nucleotide adenylyltransferase [Elusimicrobiaceae bacterium]